MTAARLHLFEYPAGMNQSEVETVLRVSEHGIRQLRTEGRLSPVTIGNRNIYPRWQVAALMGLDDPDVAVTRAATEAAQQLIVNAETAPVPLSAVPASHDQVDSLETHPREVTRGTR